MNLKILGRGLREISVVFLGATLLFLIQPIAGQRLMAAYGGSPAVWLATLLFFQLGLFLGYAWGFLVAKIPSISGQAMLQMGLLMATVLLTLPVDIGPVDFATDGSSLMEAESFDSDVSSSAVLLSPDHWQPLTVILGLAVQLLLPVICLGSVSPLIQSWGARIPGRRPPYWLYAISNLASLLALVAYPFWIQPAWDLAVQQRLWTLAFFVFVTTFIWNVLAVVWASSIQPESATAVGSGTSDQQSLDAEQVTRDSPTAGRSAGYSAAGWQWLLLAFLPSMLLMATTNQITADVAAGPLFWTLPLAAYLGTFTLAFSLPIRSRIFVGLGFAGLASMVIAPMISRFTSVTTVVTLGCVSLFLVSFECHRRLADRQPDQQGLPAFYLWMALAGLLGGVVSNFIAPLLFSNYYELELAVMATAFVLYFGQPVAGERETDFETSGQNALLRSTTSRRFAALLKSMAFLIVLMVGIAGMFTKWPFVNRFDQGALLEQRRTFHGVLRVIEKQTQAGTVRTFGHGWTDHGSRLIDGQLASWPSGYYARNSGVSFAFSEARSGQPSGLNVCVLGLGAGSLLSWKEPEDTFEFVEIDAAVIQLQQEFFAEMNQRDSVRFHVGDGRKFLEAKEELYDLIVLDAFTGDSVPSHLLTAQAMDVYLQRCQLQGVIAVNISNRYLDFEPVLLQLARQFNLDMAQISYQPKIDFDNAGGRIPEEFREFTRKSDWVILSRAPFTDAVVQRADFYYSGYDPIDENPAAMWQDDYSPILPLLK